MFYRKRYREHNQLVRCNVDQTRFLEMNVKEGWKPLCQFLDLPVPDREFPFRNKSGKEGQTGEFLEEIMEPHIKRCKLEVSNRFWVFLTHTLCLGRSFFNTVNYHSRADALLLLQNC